MGAARYLDGGLDGPSCAAPPEPPLASNLVSPHHSRISTPLKWKSTTWILVFAENEKEEDPPQIQIAWPAGPKKRALRLFGVPGGR